MFEPAPRPQRFRWRWLVLALLFGGLSAAWLLKSEPPPRIVFALSNTQQVGWIAAGLGRLEHSEQSPVYRWCYRMLSQYAPVLVTRQLPAPRVTTVWNVKSKTGADGLILFFERHGSSAAPNPARYLQELIKLEFEDSNGHRCPGEIGSRVQYGDGRELLCFESFPRRDPKLVIHLIDRADETKTFRFEIDNPGYRADFPIWTPEELPQTKSDSAIEVTLRELDADSVAKGKTLPVNVITRDPAWSSRTITSWLEDATGNNGNALSPFETAWKARLSIARTDLATFQPTDKWTLGPFSLPAAASKMQIGQSKDIHGFRFVVQSLEAGKTYTQKDSQPAQRASPETTPSQAATAECTFRVDLSGPASGFLLIARVEDQAGEQLTRLNHPFATKGQTVKSVHGVRFKPNPETTQVTLTLVVSQPREFEFIFSAAQVNALKGFRMPPLKLFPAILLGLVAASIAGAAPPFPQSPVITGVKFDWSTHERRAPGSDNWPLAWADDGHLYTAFGDGGGFGGTNSKGRVSLGVARIEGDWNNYQGHNVWGGVDAEREATFPGKSYGMISVDGVLTMWNSSPIPNGPSQPRPFQECRLTESRDHGKTWQTADWIFTREEGVMVPTICQFGRDDTGARDDYVYHYLIRFRSDTGPDTAPDRNACLVVQRPGAIDLARVPKHKQLDRSAWTFFAGRDDKGQPTWTADLARRQPVFEDRDGGVGWNVGVSYNPGLKRYVLCTEHGESHRGIIGMFDAPEPWGPWTTVLYEDDWGAGHIPLNTFCWFLPTKWMSADGRAFTLVFSGRKENDSWNTVRGEFLINPTR